MCVCRNNLIFKTSLRETYLWENWGFKLIHLQNLTVCGRDGISIPPAFLGNQGYLPESYIRSAMLWRLFLEILKALLSCLGQVSYRGWGSGSLQLWDLSLWGPLSSLPSPGSGGEASQQTILFTWSWDGIKIVMPELCWLGVTCTPIWYRMKNLPLWWLGNNRTEKPLSTYYFNLPSLYDFINIGLEF